VHTVTGEITIILNIIKYLVATLYTYQFCMDIG